MQVPNRDGIADQQIPPLADRSYFPSDDYVGLTNFRDGCGRWWFNGFFSVNLEVAEVQLTFLQH